VVGLALYDADPKTVGAPCLKRIFGSDPGGDEVIVPLPDCNTTGLKEAPCLQDGSGPRYLHLKREGEHGKENVTAAPEPSQMRGSRQRRRRPEASPLKAADRSGAKAMARTGPV